MEAADPDAPYGQDDKDKTPEATEFGDSEKAANSKMSREMNHTDGIHIDGQAFEPMERDPNDP